MLNPDVQRHLDESAAFLGDTLPPLWRRLYDGCLFVGFSETEAMELVKTYILSGSLSGIRGTK